MSSPQPNTAAPAAGAAPRPPDAPALPSREIPPGYVCVLCPTGFTASSKKEHAHARPLYAHLIYRPL